MRSLDALPIAGESSGERDFMSGTLYLPGGEDKILLAADRHRSVTTASPGSCAVQAGGPASADLTREQLRLPEVAVHRQLISWVNEIRL